MTQKYNGYMRHDDLNQPTCVLPKEGDGVGYPGEQASQTLKDGLPSFFPGPQTFLSMDASTLKTLAIAMVVVLASAAFGALTAMSLGANLAIGAGIGAALGGVGFFGAKHARPYSFSSKSEEPQSGYDGYGACSY